MADIKIYDLAVSTDAQGYVPIDNGTNTLKTPLGYLPLDTTAQSGTDKELYDALVALGWTDCIE